MHISAPDFLRNLEPSPTVWIRLWVPALDDEGALRQRGFTLVDPNPAAGTFALDFVVHEPTGPAAHWATHVRPGESVEIAFTPAKLTPDPSIGRFVLVGDATAIPAINSLLAALPESTSVDVLLADPHDDAASLLREHAGARVTHVANAGDQLSALRALDLDLADTYVWAAGERRTISAVREVVRREWKLPRDRQHTQYYWIEGKPFG